MSRKETMTRKDTILITVIINAGLLAVLFTTAVIFDTDKGIEQSEFVSTIVDNKTSQTEPSLNVVALASTGDEVDNVLKYYNPPAQPLVVMPHSDPSRDMMEPLTLQSTSPLLSDEEELPLEFDAPLQQQFVEVKVKKGDVLEKIARAHKTTVKAIKKANQLENESLFVGQVLKVPKSTKKVEKVESKKEEESTEPVYYVIKSGDNPWKIAKQYHVKFEDILILNHLDEEKARNLKIGDRIRVK